MESSTSTFFDRSIDECRPMKVICIGAGISGIATGIKLPRRIENLDLNIYEKNADIGGTWYENRYPGIACDIPAHAYQFTFANNHNWSHFYASGREVHKYLTDVVETYNVRQYIKFQHTFQGASWLAKEGKWEVSILRQADQKVIIDTADVLIKATGLLNTWKWPEIPGLANFQGTLLHTADYDESFDHSSKRIAVIGSGSTGIQLVPALQAKAAQVDSYCRSKAWVSPQGPFSEEVEKRGGKENFEHSAEEIAKFNKNPSAYLQYRHEIEGIMNRGHLGMFRGSLAQRSMAQKVETLVDAKLSTRPDILAKIKPDYPVGCKRLGAAPGYLEALQQENVELITSGIKDVRADGILDNTGVFRKVDAVICATGFDTSLDQVSTPIIGQDGAHLHDVWKTQPEAYMSLAVAQMPNLFLLLGPNGAPAATMIVMVEFQVDYIIKCVQKLQREWLKAMVPSLRAKNAWIQNADRYFATTVLTDNCKSWLKGSDSTGKGRIQALWPGSLVHARFALQNPRWEDFEYEMMEELEGNSFNWWGKGVTKAQACGGWTTDYLDIGDQYRRSIE